MPIHDEGQRQRQAEQAYSAATARLRPALYTATLALAPSCVAHRGVSAKPSRLVTEAGTAHRARRCGYRTGAAGRVV